MTSYGIAQCLIAQAREAIEAHLAQAREAIEAQPAQARGANGAQINLSLFIEF